MPKLGQGDKVALIFFVLLAVFIFIAVMSSKSSPSVQNSKTTTSSIVKTETNPTDPPQAKEWVKVTELSGSADKAGDTFTLTGGKVRVTYNYTGPEYAVGAIYIIPEGKESAQYVTMTNGPASDSTIVRKEAGDYYLKATAYEASYTVTVEEEK